MLIVEYLRCNLNDDGDLSIILSLFVCFGCSLDLDVCLNLELVFHHEGIYLASRGPAPGGAADH